MWSTSRVSELLVCFYVSSGERKVIELNYEFYAYSMYCTREWRSLEFSHGEKLCDGI